MELNLKNLKFKAIDAPYPIGFINNFIDENFPVGRMGTPEEVAELVTFLCSKNSGFINGSQIVIDGGQSVSY